MKLKKLLPVMLIMLLCLVTFAGCDTVAAVGIGGVLIGIAAVIEGVLGAIFGALLAVFSAIASVFVGLYELILLLF